MIVSEVLEFDRVRREVAALTHSERGAREISEFQILSDGEALETLLDLVEAAAEGIDRKIPLPGTYADDISDVLESLRPEGSQTDTTGLAAVIRLIRLASEYRTFLTHDENPEILFDLGTGLTVPRDLQKELTRYITTEGDVREESIPELREVRKALADSFRRIQKVARNTIRSGGRMYRDSGATLRNGRTVLPLVLGFQGRIDGIVHELSDSGNTVFVEPTELVHLNNEYVALENQAHMVINALLRRLSSRVRDETENLRILQDKVGEVDGVVARARYSAATGGIRPEVSTRIALHGARHPFLGSSCIPMDIVFGTDTHLLVISGPNTGGKTVLLKTLGLLAAMHQFGLPIPVRKGSTLPLFSGIEADIGDSQSIDRALSTFSAHLENLGRIVGRVGSGSLVLLDELGTGTDPDEASALAMAYIDSLLERDASILITTHLTVLKHYGFTHPRAANASVAFDDETHRPTYRVIPGVPGTSHALETAEAVGFPAPILDRAREYAREGSSNVAEIISRLTTLETELVDRRNSLQNEKAVLDIRIRSLEEKEETLRTEEARLRKEGLVALRKFLSESRKDVEAAVRELRERKRDTPSKNDRPEAERRVRTAVSEIESRIESELSKLDELSMTSPSVSDGPLFDGASVVHLPTGRSGTVRTIKGGNAEVQFSTVRMTVPVNDLRRTATDNASAGSPVTRSHDSVNVERRTSVSVRLELDLRGYRLEAALQELERQVDDAVVSGIFFFSVVHGKGTGVLQKGVHDFLAEHPEIERFEFAPPEQGGYGCTYVYLKKSLA